jgi:hypothetical protein
VQILRKAHQDTLHRTPIFAYGRICGSRSAFWCIRGVKRQHTIFHDRVGLVRFPQKAHRDRLRRIWVFCICCDMQVTLSILVCPGQETSTHYFPFSSRTDTIFTKSALGHVTPNLCFCIWWDLRVALSIPVRSGRKTQTHYFSCSGGPGAVSIKSASRYVTPNLCFGIRWDLRIT